MIEQKKIPEAGQDETWAEIDNEIGYQKHEDKTQTDEQAKEAELAALFGENEKEQTPGLDHSEDGEQVGDDLEDEPEEVEEPEAEPEPELDYDQEIEVPMAYGMEKMTIGQLKDIAQDQHLEAQRIIKQQNELNLERAKLRDISSAFGITTPEAEAAVERYRQDQLPRETERMMQAIPEWEDNAVLTRDTGLMVDLAKEYGVSAEEIGGIYDHRHIRILRDYAILKQKLEGATRPKIREEKKKPVAKKKHARESAASKKQAMYEQASKSNDPKLKDQAIKTLLE